MFIVHGNGNPVVMKTNRGNRFVAFTSFEDGLEYLKGKRVPYVLGTLDEILQLNPRAFPKKFSILCLPSREAISLLTRDPQHFPTNEYLVTLTHNVSPPPKNSTQTPLPAMDDKQDKFIF